MTPIRSAASALALVLAVACGSPQAPVSQRVARGLALCHIRGSEPWDYRCFASVDDLKDEIARIDAARREFSEHLREGPADPHEYLVSFAPAVRVRPLLEALGATSEIQLRELHVWLAVPGAHSASQGFYSPDSFGWPQEDPKVAASRIREEDLRYLREHIRAIQSMGRGPCPEAAIARRQLLDSMRIQKYVRQHGSLAYGMRCRCTPRALDALVGVVSGLRFRAIEADSPEDRPIWPENMSRRLHIITGGLYGRGPVPWLYSKREATCKEPI